MQLDRSKTRLLHGGPHTFRSFILEYPNALNACRQLRDDGLRLLHSDAPFAGSEDKSQGVRAGFNGSLRIVNRGSGTEFNPGLHKFWRNLDCKLVDCPTPISRSCGQWRIETCFFQKLAELLSGIIGAHQRFTNQKDLIAKI